MIQLKKEIKECLRPKFRFAKMVFTNFQKCAPNMIQINVKKNQIFILSFAVDLTYNTGTLTQNRYTYVT